MFNTEHRIPFIICAFVYFQRNIIRVGLKYRFCINAALWNVDFHSFRNTSEKMQCERFALCSETMQGTEQQNENKNRPQFCYRRYTKHKFSHCQLKLNSADILSVVPPRSGLNEMSSNISPMLFSSGISPARDSVRRPTLTESARR